MHASWFEYTITKPYPFRWFTPVVIIGGSILVAVFTFLTIATSGYALQPFYTSNPNATIDQDYWFTRAPFAWRGSLAPSCQVRELPIGSRIFTSNLGFSYQLTSVIKPVSASGRARSLPSLPYLNQVLKDCEVIDVRLRFERLDLATKNLFWWSWNNGNVVATASCTIATPEGDLATTFAVTLSEMRDFSYMIQNDNQNATSLWWASRLINAYYASTLTALANVEPYDGTIESLLTQVRMVFTTNQTDDAKDYNLFSLTFFFLQADATVDNAWSQSLTKLYNNPENFHSETLTQSLAFSQLLYSAVLVDLGQSKLSNLLLDPTLLQWALNHPDDVFRNDPDNLLNSTKVLDFRNWNTVAGPENYDDSKGPQDGTPRHERTLMSDAFQKYAPAASGPGALGTRDATIFSQYTCSVPVRKDGGAIFFSVIVAVLVYLRAAWALLNVIAKPLARKQDPLGAKMLAIKADDTPNPFTPHNHADDTYGLLPLQPLANPRGYTPLGDDHSMDTSYGRFRGSNA